ncbi:nitrous oxide reductase family maturation protein NosD [Streptomyces phyllanthi]|uniref:DUF1565 domain-containing protein n=1 Tax=Streptomyces phyllanthi TaxID=1803180 RepID=A0A5N8W012_9ACTN|nr:right-handed parallel beta-helix repeat-containing protein [Streptomyces phyllanthi]MPY39628.1 DUF1565 domain-containing protein [Streptomyces phyllanthi]
MTKRHITYLACTMVVVTSGLGAASPGSAPTTHLVRPGESIQQAVDAAKPGDTVLLSAGTYRESVRVTTSQLTLRGAGRRTVLKPGIATAGNSCAQAGNGICVEGTKDRAVKGTTVASLTLSGFTKNGLWATRTDRLTVRRVTARKNGVWGIAQERSTRGVFRNNTARDNGDAGLFLANTTDTEQGATDTRGTVIDGNRLTGNRIGVTVRRLRNLTVEDNTLTTNCAAVFIVGDETPPRAGALTVRGNNVFENNKYCAKTARLPFLQGAGIILTGAEDTLVSGNRVMDHVGTSPLSGGIVLFKSFVGVKSERNRISDNLVLRNSPADIVNEEAAQGNTFRTNTCDTSKPKGLC